MVYTHVVKPGATAVGSPMELAWDPMLISPVWGVVRTHTIIVTCTKENIIWNRLT